jgi:hypothetical protein
MPNDFVTVKNAPKASVFRAKVEDFRDEVVEMGGQILRREEEASIRARFYRTGAGLRSLREELITDGQRKIYRLFPTAYWMAFGEYGTGRRGAATGRPSPRGWRYGQRAGMAARRYSRIAVGVAKPQIDRDVKRRAAAFARNFTVN